MKPKQYNHESLHNLRPVEAISKPLLTRLKPAHSYKFNLAIDAIDCIIQLFFKKFKVKINFTHLIK